MHPYFHLFGLTVPAFGTMLLLAALAGAGIALWQCKADGFSISDLFLVCCFTLAGACVGLFLIKPLISIPKIVIDWHKTSVIPVYEYLGWFFGDMVFYGGLIGGALAAYWFCRRFKMPFLRIADICAPAIPVSHAIGRIGCLLGGCCYGVRVSASNPFAIIYPARNDIFAEAAAPAGVPLLAVPIIESAANLLIFGTILFFGRKKPRDGSRFALYGILYGTQRFILEFFRGDLVRGVYGGVSTSQIISVGVIAVSAVLTIKIKTARKA